MVRIPLGGRRVRGYVVELGQREPGRLRPITSVSMEATLFDPPLLRSLTWAAHRYVAPVSVMLDRSAPPNLARKANMARTANLARPAAPEEPGHDLAKHPLAAWAAAAATGKRQPAVAYMAR